jgi:hypothetical protein
MQTLNFPSSSFRLDADESWSVSANEWGLFTRYFDAPDCVKTLVQWAEEKCIAASVPILMHPDTLPIKELLEIVFTVLHPPSDGVAEEEPFATAFDGTVETPRKGSRKTRAHEIDEVAAFLRTHLFVKVSHLRALSEEDWDKLSRQKIPYRVVKMLQSQVCQIAKCLKCIDYNVIISTSAIQQFCKSKEDMLRPALPSRDASQSDATFQLSSSRQSVSASVQRIKVTKVDLKEDGTLSINALNLNPNPKVPLKIGDRIIIGTIGTSTPKDSPFTVISIDGNKFSVMRKPTSEALLMASSKSASLQHVEAAADQPLNSPVAASSLEAKKAGNAKQSDSLVVNKIYTFEMASQQKQSAQNTPRGGSGGLQADTTDDAAGVPSNQVAMPSPRMQAAVALESPRLSSRQAASQNVDALSPSGNIKAQKKGNTKVTVSFDDKMLNSTLRIALQFLCDITCKSNKFLDYQRLFMTEKTLKYLIQVVEILGRSEKLLHQEIAVLAVKYHPRFI